MDDVPVKIIQLSDIHLYANNQHDLLGVPTRTSFQAVLDDMKKHEQHIDLMVLSGDLSQDGSAASYALLATMLQPFNVPIYCIEGNHDNSQAMRQVFPQGTISLERQIVLPHWQLILLNSQRPGKVDGYLDKGQLHFLQECLRAYPNKHTLIAFHHQPIPTGTGWLDPLGLTNADVFWQQIASYSQIKAVLFGHVHQEYQQTVQGVECYAVPSTCIQFKCHETHFHLDHLPPGYRWLELHADGRIETGVKRLDHYIGVFDSHAKGY